MNTERRVSVCELSPHQDPLKSINTNENIEEIFLSVNFQEITMKKKLKQSKKNNNDVSFLPTVKSIDKFIGKL